MEIIYAFKGSFFAQKEEITLDLPQGTTVKEALLELVKHQSKFQSLIFKDEKIRSDILIMVDKIDVLSMELLNLQLKDKQKIIFLPLAHGG